MKGDRDNMVNHQKGVQQDYTAVVVIDHMYPCPCLNHFYDPFWVKNDIGMGEPSELYVDTLYIHANTIEPHMPWSDLLKSIVHWLLGSTACKCTVVQSTGKGYLLVCM